MKGYSVNADLSKKAAIVKKLGVVEEESQSRKSDTDFKMGLSREDREQSEENYVPSHRSLDKSVNTRDYEDSAKNTWRLVGETSEKNNRKKVADIDDREPKTTFSEGKGENQYASPSPQVISMDLSENLANGSKAKPQDEKMTDTREKSEADSETSNPKAAKKVTLEVKKPFEIIEECDKDSSDNEKQLASP